MTFVLRQISRSAEGREIVRGSRVEGDRLTIGRDPASDIHLTDLAVALHHATIQRVADNKLEVAAEKGLKIELNGRSVERGEIDLGAGGDIRIASHRLTILSVPPGSDEIAIDIGRVSEGEARTSPQAERLFSLSSVLPSKRAAAWVLALLVLALFLAWPIRSFYARQAGPVASKLFHADETWTAGPLSQAHAQLSHDCKACHVQPFVSVRDTACLACHTDIHDHADPIRLARARPNITGWGKVKLAFQETFNLPPGRCIDCHTEHEGPQQMPMTQQRFCSDCHADLKSRLPDTRLGNAADFGTLHPQFTPAIVTHWDGNRPVLQRVSLSANPHEMSNLKFPHALHLSKTNGVAQMARRLGGDFGFGNALECKDCHVPTPDGVRFQPVNMEKDCGMCHSLAFDRENGIVRTLRHGEPRQVVAELRDFYRAHPLPRPAALTQTGRRRPGSMMLLQNERQFARAVADTGSRAERAIRAVFSPGGACYDCHVVVAPPAGSLNYGIRPVALQLRYMRQGWFDHKAHATEDCTTCHTARRSDAASDLLIPGIATCRECHGGESSHADVPSACAMCHDYHQDQGAPEMVLRNRIPNRKKSVTAAGLEVPLTENGHRTGRTNP